MESDRRRAPPRVDELFGPRASRMVLFQKLLQALVRTRYTPTRVERARVRGGRSLGGCLMRMLLAVVLLFVALASAAFLFGRALLGG